MNDPDDSEGYREVARFLDPFQALIVVSMLQAHGLDVYSPDFNTSFGMEGGAFFLGGGRLFAAANQLDQARSLIEHPPGTIVDMSLIEGPWGIRQPLE
jgi:hypothetical protein